MTLCTPTSTQSPHLWPVRTTRHRALVYKRAWHGISVPVCCAHTTAHLHHAVAWARVVGFYVKDVRRPLGGQRFRGIHVITHRRGACVALWRAGLVALWRAGLITLWRSRGSATWANLAPGAREHPDVVEALWKGP